MLTNSNEVSDGSDEEETGFRMKLGGELNKVGRWMRGADKINRRL